MDLLNDMVKDLGFKDKDEFFTLVAEADLTTPEKLESFNDWKLNDGTKEGLLKLKTLKPPIYYY